MLDYMTGWCLYKSIPTRKQAPVAPPRTRAPRPGAAGNGAKITLLIPVDRKV